MTIATTIGVVLILLHGKIFDAIHFPVHQVARTISTTLGQLFECALCLGFWATATVWLSRESPTLLGFSLLFGGSALPILAIGKLDGFRDVIAASIVGALITSAVSAYGWAWWDGGIPFFIDLGSEAFRGAAACLAADLVVRRLAV